MGGENADVANAERDIRDAVRDRGENISL